MKRNLITIILILASGIANAQKIKVTEEKERIGGGNNNALEVIIYQATPEMIEKEVKSLLKDYDAKITSQDGGWFGDNAVIKKMGSNSVDIYAKWDKINDTETKLVMAFDLGGGFVSSSDYKMQFSVAKEIVNNFAVRITNDAMKELVKNEERNYIKLIDEEKELQKQHKNLNEEIEVCKQKIEEYNNKLKKAQEDIEQNKINIGTKQQEVTAQLKVVNGAKEKQKAIN